MKLYLFATLLCLSSIVNAQLSFESKVPTTGLSNSQNLNSAKPSMSKEEFQNLVGYSMYNATIIGYAKSCNFTEIDQKTVYDDFYKKVSAKGLTPEELQIVNKNFYLAVTEASTRGVANSKITCDTFSKDFNKIVSYIKQNH